MTEPTTEAGKALLALLRQAVLDPAIAKMLSPEGKQELVALVSLDLLEREILAIEAEAHADTARPSSELREALEWALDELAQGDEIIGPLVVGQAVEYTLNGVRMGRATTYAKSFAKAQIALGHTVMAITPNPNRPPSPPKRDLNDPTTKEWA